MEIDYTSFEKAINSLERALKEYDINPSEFVKDSCIQRFEYTYELASKSIKRYLEQLDANPSNIDTMSFQEIIREANEKDILLNDWESWKKYRIFRGSTSHSYDEKKADEIFKEIPYFLNEIQYLLKKIK